MRKRQRGQGRVSLLVRRLHAGDDSMAPRTFITATGLISGGQQGSFATLGDKRVRHTHRPYSVPFFPPVLPALSIPPHTVSPSVSPAISPSLSLPLFISLPLSLHLSLLSVSSFLPSFSFTHLSLNFPFLSLSLYFCPISCSLFIFFSLCQCSHFNDFFSPSPSLLWFIPFHTLWLVSMLIPQVTINVTDDKCDTPLILCQNSMTSDITLPGHL